MIKFLATAFLLALLLAPALPAAAQSPAKSAAAPYHHIIPILPAKLSICGQPVPLKRPLVADYLDREMVIAVHDPAQTIMWLKRAARYFPYIEKRLKQAGLPDDLKYVAVAESALIHYIRSPAGAVGYWQFISATGRRYGLRINRWYDDRRNLALATSAALKYFKDLHAEFNSWPLALAAYNCGERRVGREIKEQGTRDYFDLALPVETQRYVYRILAAKLVISSPERYGYALPQSSLYKPVPGQSVTLVLKRPTHLTVVAKAAGTSYRQLKELNPELRRRHLPKGRVTIMVPPGAAAGLQARLNKAGPAPSNAGDNYVVKRGDSLTSIARRHGVSLGDLREANDLDGTIIQPGQRLKIPEK
ncbi:MAG: transglycosylase SLT domain-containing protein [Desulfarculaceae bacterium]|nr:transglycosylase SLT domain-containing protein [Desulfarculaceae bacterium]MCF8074267.1 transglycosylase SLT domain-containing protein [Desulfarculaceae bacterium]MCF8102974.1 transglycosylase SLT domain-containing protein [Desulfarculaceae bacterium]MCF8117105.1 transglycosylase SLT domain-containing protein [Desulfarculaceae bacterium]